MQMSSPFQQLSAATIPPNALRIKEIEVETTTMFVKVTPIVGSELDEINEIWRTINIPHDDFRNWLESEERLTFESNTSDHTGAHVQVQHEMSYTEYIVSPPDGFYEDLIDYLKYAGKITLPYIPQA